MLDSRKFPHRAYQLWKFKKLFILWPVPKCRGDKTVLLSDPKSFEHSNQVFLWNLCLAWFLRKLISPFCQWKQKTRRSRFFSKNNWSVSIKNAMENVLSPIILKTNPTKHSFTRSPIPKTNTKIFSRKNLKTSFCTKTTILWLFTEWMIRPDSWFSWSNFSLILRKNFSLSVLTLILRDTSNKLTR